MNEREQKIRIIRSRLPYLSEIDLDIMIGIAKGEQCKFSDAEYGRPVLSEAEQRNVDSAYRLMEAVGNALAGRYGAKACCITEEGTTPPPGAKVIGYRRGDLVAMDISAMMELYREWGWKRVKRLDMLEVLETAGYILPRSLHPKAAIVGNARHEVVYIPVCKIHEFTGHSMSSC